MNKLTAITVKKAKPADRARKMADGGGLFIVIEKDGRKWWRLRYWIERKERALSLGTYPEVSLSEARRKRDEIRQQIRDGKDPAQERKRSKGAEGESGPNLATVAGQWLAKQGWTSNYREKVEGRLRKHILPLLGHRPASEITPPELLKSLHLIEEAGTIETAQRCRQHLSRIYKFAIASGLTQFNPAAGLEEAMTKNQVKTHYAAITDPEELGGALRAMYGLERAIPQVRGALKLLPLLMLRPGELVSMEWDEWKQRDQWEIPAEKMKMRNPHIVPLAMQAIAILEELRPYAGGSKYVFPSARSPDRHLTVESLTAALRRLGYSGDILTAHGFRATARTLLDEELKFRPDFIEHQLAHSVRDPNGRAYNRATHLEERKEMMQKWADYLDGLRGAPAAKGPLAEAISRQAMRKRKSTAAEQAGFD